MCSKKVVLFCLMFCTVFSRASKIEDAFEALSIYDYFKAKKLFYSQINKPCNSAAAYGLATIFYRSDNPFHQLDSAAKYITLSGNFYKINRPTEPYGNFKFDSTLVFAMADSISNKLMNRAYKINSVSGYEGFLTANPYANSLLKKTALYLRDELCYKQNVSYNKSDSTRIFILRYPESNFLSECLVLLDKQVFEEFTNEKTRQQLIDFIKTHPKNKFVLQAQDELFDIDRKNNNISDLDFYVRNYKNSHSVNEAWKLLYALSVKSYNTSELQGFVERYPEFPFKASINKEIELNNKTLIPINDSDYIGFIDTMGKYSIPAVYEAASGFKEGLSVVQKGDSAFFINKENTNVFNSFYNEAYPFINGIAPVNIKDQWFLINRQGQKIQGPYEDMSEQSEGSYVIKQNNKYGAIDVYGNYIIQAQFDKMGDFKNGMAYVVNNGLYGFVNKTGGFSKARYQWISDFDENKIAIVKFNNFYGLVNTEDNFILNPAYELIVKGANNVFIIVKNNKYGFFSGKGCFLSEIDFDFRKELSASFYTNGKLFKLIKNKKQALMDWNGRISIGYEQYEEVNFAQSNLIRIKRKNKYGFVDRKLNIVIPCKYSSATDFIDSLSICTLKQDVFLINTKGETIFKTKGSIELLANAYFWVKEEEGNKLLNLKGKVLFTGISSYQISEDTYLILEFENKNRKVLRMSIDSQKN